MPAHPLVIGPGPVVAPRPQVDHLALGAVPSAASALHHLITRFSLWGLPGKPGTPGTPALLPGDHRNRRYFTTEYEVLIDAPDVFLEGVLLQVQLPTVARPAAGHDVLKPVSLHVVHP